MMAGGLTRDAKADDLRVERGSDEIWQGDRLQTALTKGETIEEMALRSGDRIVVPRDARWGTREIVSLVVGLPAAIYAIVAIAR